MISTLTIVYLWHQELKCLISVLLYIIHKINCDMVGIKWRIIKACMSLVLHRVGQ